MSGLNYSVSEGESGRTYRINMPGRDNLVLCSPSDTSWGADDSTGYGLWDASQVNNDA